MADIQILGHITNIRYERGCILLFIDEYRKGYVSSGGIRVDDKVLSWCCIFSGNERKRVYVDKYFGRGSYVQVKGEVLPYAIREGVAVDGYSVFVQSLNLACYPNKMLRAEKKLLDSSVSMDVPDVPSVQGSDF